MLHKASKHCSENSGTSPIICCHEADKSTTKCPEGYVIGGRDIGEIISIIVSLCRHNGFTPSQPRPCVLRVFWHRSHTGPVHFCVPKPFIPLSECFLSASRPCKHLSKLATVGDGDLSRGLTVGRTVGLDLLDDIQTLHDLTEDDVLAIQPSGLLGADEELGAVASELSAAVAGVL